MYIYVYIYMYMYHMTITTTLTVTITNKITIAACDMLCLYMYILKDRVYIHMSVCQNRLDAIRKVLFYIVC